MDLEIKNYHSKFNTSEFSFYSFLIIIFAFFLISSFSIKWPANLFPALLSALGIIITLAILLKSIKITNNLSESKSEEEQVKYIALKEELPPWFAGLLILFVAMFFMIGLLPAIAIFCVVVMKYLNIKWTSIVVAISIYLIVFYAMFALLHVRVPLGLIG